MSEPVKFEKDTVIVVFGASGDLAKKKTFPALFGLFREGYLDSSTKIYGYARSDLSHEALRERIEPYLKRPNGNEDDTKVEEFFKMITYIHGAYDTADGYVKLRKSIEEFESERKVSEPHRLFYFALPPSVFLTVATHIKNNLYANDGVTRLIVEKPFGHDLESAKALQKDLAPLFREDEIFRIDHYWVKNWLKIFWC